MARMTLCVCEPRKQAPDPFGVKVMLRWEVVDRVIRHSIGRGLRYGDWLCCGHCRSGGKVEGCLPRPCAWRFPVGRLRLRRPSGRATRARHKKGGEGLPPPPESCELSSRRFAESLSCCCRLPGAVAASQHRTPCLSSRRACPSVPV